MTGKEGVLITFSILMPLFASCQVCQRLNSTMFPHCSKYYNYTVSLRTDRNVTQQNFTFGDSYAHSYAYWHTPNCSQAMELLMCTWYVLPGCSHGSPVLPCRKVCQQIFNKCGKSEADNGMEWIINVCNLIPFDTNKTENCIDLPEFTRDFAGPPQRSCYRLNVSICKGFGYENTLLHPGAQRDPYFLKLLRSQLVNDSDTCSVGELVNRLVCTRFIPPCFEDDPHGFYTACSSHCDDISSNCTSFMSSKNFLWNECHNLGTQKKQGGICKVTTWRNSYFWSRVTNDNTNNTNNTNGTKSNIRPIPPEVIVAIVLAVVVTAAVSLIIVLLWRRYFSSQPAAFNYHRYGQRSEDNTDELEL